MIQAIVTEPLSTPHVRFLGLRIANKTTRNMRHRKWNALLQGPSHNSRFLSMTCFQCIHPGVLQIQQISSATSATSRSSLVIVLGSHTPF